MFTKIFPEVKIWIKSSPSQKNKVLQELLNLAQIFFVILSFIQPRLRYLLGFQICDFLCCGILVCATRELGEGNYWISRSCGEGTTENPTNGIQDTSHFYRGS